MRHQNSDGSGSDKRTSDCSADYVAFTTVNNYPQMSRSFRRNFRDPMSKTVACA
jgi:hypothetical protein